jgi:hypothetical protein
MSSGATAGLKDVHPMPEESAMLDRAHVATRLPAGDLLGIGQPII